MEDLVEFLQVSLSKNFFLDDDVVIEQLQANVSELRRNKLELPAPGKEEEFPKKPLGQLPPDLATPLVNHVGNGESHAEPAEPPREPSPAPERLKDSRPPSRARRESLDKSIRHHKAERRDAPSRGSGEIPNEHPKRSTTNTPERTVSPPSAPTPTPQTTTVDRGKPPTAATENNNSNAGSSNRKDKEITPRWFKPSETKLEAVKAAAAREIQLSRGGSPAPSSPDDSTLLHHRPRSQGFNPGSNRGSNASQYDNVPGLPEQQQDFEILELDRPPSRMRTPRPETPFGMSAVHQSSPVRGPIHTGNSTPTGSAPRMVKHPFPQQLPHNSPTGVHYHTPPHQHSPARTTTEVPILHPAYSVSLDQRGGERFYAPPVHFPPPNVGVPPGERAYATTQRQPSRHSPEKALNNNSFATYRRQPPPGSAHNPRYVRPLPEHSLPFENQGSSSPIYLQQFTSAKQVYAPNEYRFEGHRRGEFVPQHPSEGGHRGAADRPQWEPQNENPPPPSPGSMPRSPSFLQAQMSPVSEFTFPPDVNQEALLSYRTQEYQEYQEQAPVMRQQLPQLFGAPHYRHAQEAFALQESMLL